MVFLSHPFEWPYLLDLLSLYGRVSNAKVNLTKTVIVYISGRNQPEWISTAQRHHLEWHDSTSNNAVVSAPFFSLPAGRSIGYGEIKNNSA